MTKVGEGNGPFEEPSVSQYHEQLDINAIKFLNALDAYKEAGNENEKTHFKGVMDSALGLIRSAVQEMRPGIAKQEKLVESDYRAYMKNENDQTLSKLEEDLTALRDYNKL